MFKQLSRFREWAIALSLATLCLLDEWGYIFAALSSGYPRYRPGISVLVTLTLSLIILTLAFRGVLHLEARARSKGVGILCLGFIIFFILLPVVLYVRRVTNFSVVYPIFSASHLLGNPISLWRAAIFLALGAWLIQLSVRKFSLTSKVVRTTALLFLPLLPFLVVPIVQRTMEAPSPRRPLSVRGPQAKPIQRVVWFIFDEWDYQLAFDKRPTNLHTPHIDALRSETLFAENAYSPATQTVASIPSYFLGERVSSFCLKDNDVDYALENHTKVRWSEAKSWIGALSDSGMNVGLLGWFHSYCNLLGKDSYRCHSPRFYQHGALGLFSGVLGSLVRSFSFDLLKPPRHDQVYLRIRELGLDLATSPEIDLAFIHLPVPHLPLVRSKGSSHEPLGSLQRKSVPEDYIQNLMVADSLLGDFREELTRKGMWDDAIIIMTSDHGLHPWRWNPDFKEEDIDRRIPFLIKPAKGQGGALALKEKFNTILLSELIPALLKKELASTQEMGAWIRRHQSGRPVAPTIPRQICQEISSGVANL